MSRDLREVALLFLRLGFTAFGGPAAHVAMFHDEVVRRRKWLRDQEFLDLLGATNLIPGPNSTEMTIHLGFMRAGWAGLVMGGVCFILPAMLIVTALAWAYVQFGSLPQVEWLLYGVKPVVIAVIGQALWSLGRKAVSSIPLAVIGLGVIAAYFFDFNVLVLLFAGGLAAVLLIGLKGLKPGALSALWLPGISGLGAAVMQIAVVPFSLPLLFLTFLKIGSVLYGSGYVLLAFLRADLVAGFGWLTEAQLIDAVAIGQVTPGPVFTTATFIGYLLGGLPGALLATLGIFLPSFFFVAISNPLIPRMRSSSLVGGFLDGVNAASFGLMAAVTWRLGQAALVDPLTVLVAVVSLGLLARFKVNTTWLIAGGAALGLVRAMVG